MCLKWALWWEIMSKRVYAWPPCHVWVAVVSMLDIWRCDFRSCKDSSTVRYWERKTATCESLLMGSGLAVYEHMQTKSTVTEALISEVLRPVLWDH